MASKPTKPQGTKPNKKGGNFVDPLSKWDDDGADFESLDEEEEAPAKGKGKSPAKKQGGKKPKLTDAQKVRKKAREAKEEAYDEMVDTLIKTPDAAKKLIDTLTRRLGDRSLSQAERLHTQHELVEARKSLAGANAGIAELAKEIRDSKRLEAQAYSKLNRLKTWRAMPGNEAGMDKDTLTSIQWTEEALKEFITSMSVLRKADVVKDPDAIHKMKEKLDKLLDRVSDLPNEFQEMFEDDEIKLDQILKKQKEAKEFVANQNAAIKKALWSVADKAGLGPLTLGNLIRGGRALWNLPGNVKRGIQSVTGKVGSGYDYLHKTVQMRRLASATHFEEDPTLDADYVAQKQSEAREKNGTKLDEHTQQLLNRLNMQSIGKGWKGEAQGAAMPLSAKPRTDSSAHFQEDTLRQGEEQNELLQRYVDESGRFHSRLITAVKTKKNEKKQDEDNGGLLKSMTELFGAGGLLKKLLGVAASLSAVALAGAIGYWVGSKIWEKIAPWAAEKFNKMSGLDDVARRATKPALLNTDKNFARAQSIRNAIKSKHSKDLTADDREFYAQFQQDNPNVDLDKAYAPSDRMKTINAKANAPAASAAPAPTPAGPEPVTPAALDAVGGGAGRGSINPPMVTPITTQPTVSSGDQLMGSWMGKTMTKSGDVDTDGVNPSLQANMVNMSKDYFDATGKKLQINSAFRSPQEQEQLYRTKPAGYAAKPGSSLHNYGLAVDISSQQANELSGLGLLQRYGFTRPMQKEPWHIQPTGVSVAAAKAGVYSADAPNDQGGAGGTTAVAVKPQAISVASAEPRIPVTDSGGGEVATGSGGRTQTIGGGKKSASDIPTFDTQDGHLVAMNMGVV